MRAPSFAPALALLLCLAHPTDAQEAGGIAGIADARLAPDGHAIAFSYQGDIWWVDAAGGLAHRLTDHPAFDTTPVWSPDSRQIAFASNRRGNYDVYRMPLSGGFPDRITWAPEHDFAADWHGDTLLFYSRRGPYSQDLYAITVPAAGDATALERRITADESRYIEAAFSPDGTQIAAARGRYGWTRRRYAGSGSIDVMLMGADGSAVHPFTANLNAPGERLDGFPAWGPNGALYFIADSPDGARNIYRKGLHDDSLPQPLTGFAALEENCYSLSIDDAGTQLVFLKGGRLQTMAPSGGEVRALRVRIDSERKAPESERIAVNGGASEAKVSPDGRFVAAVARGDIYIVPVTDPDEPPPYDSPRYGEAINVTDSPWRDFAPAWHPEGDRLAYVSDSDGDFEIYTLDLNTRERTQITHDAIDNFNPQYSPDGERLAWIQDKLHLVAANTEGRDVKTVGEGYFAFGGVIYSDYRWSPDSRWIAYEYLTDLWNTEIHLAPADGSAAGVNITRHYHESTTPRWSPDGSALYFVSSRASLGDLSQSQSAVYRVLLTRREPPFSDEYTFGPDADDDEEDEENDDDADDDESDDDSDDDAADEGEDAEDDEGEDEEAPEPIEPIVIDFAGIEDRIERVTDTTGQVNLGAVSNDSAWVVHGSNAPGEWALMATHARSGESKTLVDAGIDPGSVHFTADGEHLVLLGEGGSIQALGFDDGEASKQHGIDLQARRELDRMGESLQMYREGWRALKDGFYLADMHGIDWEAMYERYLPLAQNAATPEEFQLMVSLLLGELGASHLGIFGPVSFEGIGDTGARLGLDFDDRAEGEGLLVAKVIPEGPTDLEASRVEVGERVLMINGVAVGSQHSPWIELEGREYQTTLLRVQGADGEERDVKVWPITLGQEQELRYRDWVETNRRKVSEASDGKLAYIHVRSMNQPSLDTFYREFYTRVQGAEGLILDIRHNGGGNIHEQLLDALNRPKLGVGVLRDRGEVVQPSQRWDGPIVLLINEGSASDSEIFPAGFRAQGLGTIVGVPTLGAVIGTLNYPLVDGQTEFRVPLMGWYTLDGQNLENFGVPPDIFVANDPNGYRQGRDAQLDRAIAECLAQL